MKESKIEKYLIDETKKINGLCMKWVSPGNSGVPDRIVLVNHGIYFIELKRPGAEPRKLQRETIRRLQAHGGVVFVLDTIERVNRFVEMVSAVHHDKIKHDYLEQYDFDEIDLIYLTYQWRGYFDE